MIAGVLFSALAACASVGCSNPDPVQPVQPTEAATTEDGSNSAEEADTIDSSENADTAAADGNSSGSQPTPTPSPEPTLEDDEVASIVDVAAGAQVEDAQGNLIAIYGVAEWPETFQALSDDVQQQFPFFGDVRDLEDAATELLVLDVGMCAAGIDSTSFGTAEFFLHDSPTTALSTDPLLDRAVVTRHPVVQPGFTLPTTATCNRGWLPVLWAGNDMPMIARYVVATRTSASADIERHVYQWNIERDVFASAVDEDETSEQFGVGQTVSFNDGTLAETSIVVRGWAELVGEQARLEGTRPVGVELEVCPSSDTLPEFGLGVDGWNLISADPSSGLLLALGNGALQDGCAQGWVDFAVPFGAVPTSFFASDGRSAATGYAEWSLDNAALPAPE